MPPQLGKRLSRARKRAGLTQQALADRVGVHRVYIAQLETGDRTAPSLPLLERLAKALKVKLVDLLR
jgi:transcriptional regulator with XRE-family HTH domain